MALTGFEEALAQGMTGPAVHFNIGVAAWRVGDLARAEVAFREAARTQSMAALAYYNLGLVALKRNDNKTARRSFEIARDESDDERLRQLASDQLMQLPAPRQRNWMAYAAAAAGYDDNIALISTAALPAASDVADGFLEAQIAVSTPLAGPWQFDASAFTIAYRDLDEFNQQGVQAGTRYRMPLGDWRGDVGVQLGYATIDSAGLERTAIATFAAERSLSTDLRLRMRYRYYAIDGLNDFAGLTGDRHELGAQLAWQRSPWDYGFELLADSGDYRQDALSATRYALQGEVRRSFPADWAMSAELRRRHSRYDADNSSEDLTELALGVHKALTPRWRVFARFSYADNDATLDEFQYHRSRFAAGIDGVW